MAEAISWLAKSRLSRDMPFGPADLGLGPGQQGRLADRDRPRCRISGRVVVARPRAGWSVIPTSLRFSRSRSSVMSRPQESAFQERSRCPSNSSLIAPQPLPVIRIFPRQVASIMIS